jgi:hypothetical protein
LTFPGYVYVPELGHDTFGSELFFFSREDFQEATKSPLSISSFRYIQHPEHYQFLLAHGTSGSSTKDAYQLTSSHPLSSLADSVPKTEIHSSKIVLDSSGFSPSTPMLAAVGLAPDINKFLCWWKATLGGKLFQYSA